MSINEQPLSFEELGPDILLSTYVIRPLFSFFFSDTVPENYKPPRFVLILENITILEGSSARLECKVEGHPKPSIEW